MQHSITIESLRQFAASHSAGDAAADTSSTPVCGAWDPLTGLLLVGCSSGTVSCLHLGLHGSTSRRVLGRHAGRVTGACLVPWQPPEHVAAAAAVVPCARTASFFASCSADACIKLWTSNGKALQATDACVQTLRGHRAAVTSLAAVQVAHTWCLLSGSSDGQVLLWRAEPAADSGGQQLPGAAMLAQLKPHMRLAEAPLYTSSNWVLAMACPLQLTEAGAEQGVFLVLAQQPLQQVPISRSAEAVTQHTIESSAAVTARQQQQQHQNSSSNRSVTTSSSRRRPASGPRPHMQPSRLGMEATPGPGTAAAAAAVAQQASRFSRPGTVQVSHQQGSTAANCSACNSPTSSTARHIQRLQRQGSQDSSSSGGGGSSSYVSSSCCSPGGARVAPACGSEVPGTQRLSMFGVRYVPQQMGMLTLAYDGACRLHSVVEGVTKCCWRSPTGSSYVAMDLCVEQQGQVVLLGDDRGSLHLYSLATEKLLATKQVSSCRIAAVVACKSAPSSAHSGVSGGGTSGGGTSGGTSSSGSGSGSSSRDGSCVQFAVLSEDSVGLWQLRQGFSHGIAPGGHRQGVLVLQYCNSSSKPQGPLQELLAVPAAPPLTKSGSIRSFLGLSAQSETQAADDTACSSSGDGVCDSSGDGVCDSSGDGVCDSSSGSSAPGSGCGCSSSNSSGQTCAESQSAMLLSAGLDGRVIQWDVSGECPAAVQSVLACAGAAGGSELTAMTYLQGAAITVTGHDNGQLLLWRMDTGSHAVLGPQAHTNSVSCLAPVVTLKGEEQLVSGGFDGWVCLWEPRTIRGTKPHLVARFQASNTRPGSPKLLMPCSCEWAQQQQQSHSTVPGSTCSSQPASGIRARLAGSAQHGATVGRKHCWQQQQQLPLTAGRRPDSSSRRQAPGSLGASSGWGMAATAACSGAAGKCCIGSAHGGCSSSSGDVPGALDMLQQAPPEVLALLFDASNQVILTAGNDGLIKVWAGAASGVLLGQHVGHTAPVACLALDGSLLFSGAQDGSIRMWDVLPPFFVCHSQQLTARPRSPTAAAPAADGASRQRPVASSSAFAVLKGHSGAVTGLAVAADSGVLVSCGVDGQVLQWDYATRQVVGRHCLEGQGLSCLAVGPDAQQVYVGTSHGQLLTVPGSGHVVCAAGGTNDCHAIGV